MNKARSILLALVGMALATVTAAEAQDSGVDGWNVKFVGYAGPGCSPDTCIFSKNRFGQSWTQIDADGTRLRFVEEARDDWSVYLVDAGAGVRIQLDLWLCNVFYSDARVSHAQLYDISRASAGVAEAVCSGH